MKFDLEQTDALLATTRAVRKRLDFGRPVPREVILECLQLATQAPTGSNQQGWRWLLVTDPELKAAVADLYRRGGGDYLRAARELAGEGQQRRVVGSALYLAEHLQEVLRWVEGRPEEEQGEQPGEGAAPQPLAAPDPTPPALVGAPFHDDQHIQARDPPSMLHRLRPDP